jgi:PAS domain S-box-containing protein
VGRLFQLPVMFLMGLQVQMPENRLVTAAVLTIAGVTLVVWLLACTDFVHRPLSPWALVGVAVVLTLTSVLGHGLGHGFVARELPAAAAEAAAFVWTAWLLWRYGPTAPGRRTLAVLVALRGLHELDYPILANQAWGVTVGLTLSTFFAVSISMFFLILLVHEAQASAEHAEAERRGSEGRYRAIFDTAAVGVALIDREGRYLEANAAMCRLLGFSEAELVQRTYRDVTPENDRAEIDRLFGEMVRGERDLIRLEKSYRRKDGAIVHGDLSVAAVRGPDRALDHTVSIVEDITARRLAATERERYQAALVELAHRDELYSGDADAGWRAITETAAGTLRVERASVWLYTGATIRCADLYEATPRRHSGGTELVRSEYPTFFHSLETERAIAVEDARHDPRTREGVAGYIVPSGITSMLDAPIRVRGEVVGIVCHEHVGPPRAWSPEDEAFAGSLGDQAVLVLEASARAAATLALRESEARNRAAFDQAAVGLAEVSPEGRFIKANPRLCEMLGYSEAELTERRTVDVTHADDVEQDAAWIAHPVGNVYRRQKRYMRKDGSLVWAQLTSTLVRGSDGTPKFFLSVVEDITERRTLEEQLLHSQKLEALGRLAGGVAHDFNNILSAVVGYTDLVRQSLETGDPRHEDLQEVLRASDRAAGLVRQLLAFARKQAIEPRIVRLGEVLRSMEPMLRRLIGADVEFDLRTQHATPTVRVDPGRFEQVIMNLVINARDAMPSGGRLTIDTGDVYLDQEYVGLHPGSRLGRHAMVAVTDTGGGMTPEVRDRIFEPFFTTKPPGQGSGLGLATSYGIVRQAGGSIWLYTEPGLGTTFKIYLPVAEGETEIDAPILQDAAMFVGTETVLLVEDDTAVRSVVERVLSSAGYEVLAASDGEEALVLSRAHAGTIHLLVTDVVMPRLGGMQVAATLRVERAGIKVIFISGYSEDGAVRLGSMGPGVAYITKPFSIANLARRVREVLDATATRPSGPR